MEQATLFDLAPYTEESTGGYAPDWLQEKLSAAPAVRAIGLTDLRDQLDQIDQLDQNLSENDHSEATQFGGRPETSTPEPIAATANPTAPADERITNLGGRTIEEAAAAEAISLTADEVEIIRAICLCGSCRWLWDVQQKYSTEKVVDAIAIIRQMNVAMADMYVKWMRYNETNPFWEDAPEPLSDANNARWHKAALVTMPIQSEPFKKAVAIASLETIEEAIEEIQHRGGKNKTRLTVLARQLQRIVRGISHAPQTANAAQCPNEAAVKTSQEREKIYLDWRGIFRLENGEFVIRIFSPEEVELGTLTAPTTSPSIAYNLFRSWVDAYLDAEDKNNDRDLDEKKNPNTENRNTIRDTGAEFGGELMLAPELCEAKSDGLFAIGDRVTFDFSEHPHLRDFQGQITQFGVTPGTYVVRLNGRSGETHFLGKNLTLLSEQLDTGSDSSTNADIMSVSSAAPVSTDSDIVSVSSAAPVSTDSDIVSVSSAAPVSTDSDIVSVSSAAPVSTDALGFWQQFQIAEEIKIIVIDASGSTIERSWRQPALLLDEIVMAGVGGKVVGLSASGEVVPPANTDSDIVSVSSTSPANTDSDIVSVSSTSPANTDSDIVSVSSTSPANTDSDIVSVSSTSPANTDSDIVSMSSTSPANTDTNFRHQVEEYRPAGRDIKYFRYVYWVQDRRVCRHICGGNTLNALARSRAIAISQAIAQRRSPQEIERMLSGR